MGDGVLKVRIAIAVAVYAVPTVVMLVLFGFVLAAGIPLVLQAEQDDASLAAGSVPAPYRQLIVTAGHRCPEVTPTLLAAQLRQESQFDPTAVNDTSGAQGIAQFVPGSWQQWGKDYDADGTADPFNPADAVGSEADYLCALAAQLKSWLSQGVVHGDLTELILASYNAGPGAVRVAGGVPEIAETRDYVHTVSAAASTFRATGAGVGAGADDASGAANSLTQKAIAAARAEIGKPYIFGSTGPDSWDCSSLMQHAWQAAGVQISRTTYSQVESPRLRQVGYQRRRPGDLIYFKMHGGGPYDHVGMILDRSRMIEAPRTGLTVRLQSYDNGYYRSRHPMVMRVVAG